VLLCIRVLPEPIVSVGSGTKNHRGTLCNKLYTDTTACAKVAIVYSVVVIRSPPMYSLVLRQALIIILYAAVVAAAVAAQTRHRPRQDCVGIARLTIVVFILLLSLSGDREGKRWRRRRQIVRVPSGRGPRDHKLRGKVWGPVVKKTVAATETRAFGNRHEILLPRAGPVTDVKFYEGFVCVCVCVCPQVRQVGGWC